MAIAKITKRSVDAMPPGTTLFDTAIRGFMVRFRGGRKFYALKYVVAGRQRIFTIGEHGTITPEEAAKVAAKLRGRVAGGEDPQGEREAARLRSQNAAQVHALHGEDAGTFAGLAHLYDQRHGLVAKKASSRAEDQRLFRLHLLPAFGTRPIASITKADFWFLRDRMSATPFAFNRARALSVHMFNLATRWDLFEHANPAAQVDPYPEKPRQRFLSAAEYSRLFAALNALEGDMHPSVLACFRLLALTGARLSEILKLEWLWVDFERGIIKLPDSKTGAKIISLPAAALDILSRLPRECEFVLPGKRAGSHFVGIQRPWRRVRELAQLPDLRIHDLRHGFASVAAADGESMKLIGAALGHRQSATTDRYAHLSTDPVKALVERTAKKIGEKLLPHSNSNGADSVSAFKRKNISNG